MATLEKSGGKSRTEGFQALTEENMRLGGPEAGKSHRTRIPTSNMTRDHLETVVHQSSGCFIFCFVLIDVKDHEIRMLAMTEFPSCALGHGEGISMTSVKLPPHILGL
jgi:hypothetical protein